MHGTLSARYRGRTVLALGAHPDDLELGAGGTLARLARDGTRVVMAVASVPADFDTRLEELWLAATILGAELVLLVDDGPRRLDDLKHHQLVAMVDALVRELRPAALVTHSGAEFHRDHVAVHSAGVSAQRLGFFDLLCFTPTMCRPVPMAFHPRLYVDITATLETKMQAIDVHESQFARRELDTGLFRDMARLQGRMAGVEYAEGFDVLRMVLG